MKVFIAYHGGHEQRAIGAFSSYELAARFCLQYCSKDDRIEINVEEMEIDEKTINQKYLDAEMPFFVELSFDGSSAQATYAEQRYAAQ